MNSEIISAIITAAATIVACLLGEFINKKRTKKAPKQDLYKLQMTCLFEPLDIMLRFENETHPNQMLLSIEKLLREQYRIVPPKLLEMVVQIKQVKEPTWDDFLELKDLVFAYYNWLKRKFGYPHDAFAIKYKRLPGDCRAADFAHITKQMITLMFVCSTMMLGMYISDIFFNTDFILTEKELRMIIGGFTLGLFSFLDDCTSLLSYDHGLKC